MPQRSCPPSVPSTRIRYRNTSMPPRRRRAGTRLGPPGRLRLGPEPPARRDVRRRHAAADGVGLAAHRARVQLHADRRHRALSAHARAERLLPDGLGRQRPAHRAPRAELLPRALRSEGAERARPAASSRRPRRSTKEPAAAGVAARLHRAVPRSSRGEDEKAFKALWRRLGLSRRLAQEYSTIDERCRHLAQLSLPRPLGEGPRLQRRGADDVGRRLPDRGRAGRGRGPADARRVPRHRVRRRGRRTRLRDRDHAPRAAAGVRRRHRASGRRSATSTSSGSARSRRSSACRCRSSRASSPIPRRAPAS